MSNKISIGTMKKKFGGEQLFLEKHKFDCGWYWSFGYIGNNNIHAHFDSIFLCDSSKASEIFNYQKFTDHEWWVIRDLFIQAYGLQKAAEIYRYGGHQTSKEGITDIIKNKELENRINADLEKLLDKLWEYMNDCIKNQG